MDQPQIDVISAERSEAFVEPPRDAAGAVRWCLRRDEEVLARNAALGDGPSDLSLVAVDRRGVDVAVTDLQRGAHRAIRVLTDNLPGAKAEERHGATREGHGIPWLRHGH